MAFGLCVSLGIHQHERVKKIKTKKHGYKANSFFRNGLNTIRQMMKKDEQAWQQFILKFCRWLNFKLTLYHSQILVG
jgi:hypothetical protein